MLRQECPASLFEREAEVLFGALKTKSCLSEASSFCYLFSFCCQKEKSNNQQLPK